MLMEVEQGSDGPHAELCRVEHARDGAGLTVSQISEPLRNARLVLMPLGALALAKVLWLDNPFAVGLLVLGCAAGAPFLPNLPRATSHLPLCGTPPKHSR